MKTKLGFSLLELLIVLSIVLFLCAIGIPYFINNDRTMLQHELTKIESIITYLQQRAMATNQKLRLIFDTHGDTYFYEKNGQTILFQLSPQLTFGAIQGAYGPPAQPIKPIFQKITFPSAQNSSHLFCLKIFPDGKLSPGTLYLMDKKKHSMGALTCSVSQVSYIRRYLYESTQWQLFTR